jgi:general secretion pathway protein G
MKFGLYRTDESVTLPRRCQAFTRVEIHLLLLVLAILTVMVCQKIFSHSSRPIFFRSLAVHADIYGGIQSAFHQFKVDTGHYPLGTNGLWDLMRPSAGVTNWHGPYLETFPQDPWGHDYRYECPGKHNPDAYDLWTLCGPPGTKEIFGNWQ